MGVVGDLKVIFGADTTGLQKGSKQAQGLIGNVVSAIDQYKAQIASIGAIALPINEVQKWAGAVNDLEDKTNMAAESASKLLAVGEYVGLSAEEMSGAIAKMSKSAATAAEQINTATAAGKTSTDAFTKWGITILDTNGKMLSAEEIYNNINARHREMANGVEKTAMEMEIFGRSGAKMNDLLNLSEKQVRDMTDVAEQCGLVMSHQTTQGFEDATFELNKAKLAMKGVAVSIGAEMLPAFQKAADQAVDLAKWFSGLSNQNKEMIATVAELAGGLTALSLTLKAVSAIAATVVGACGTMSGGFTALMESALAAKAAIAALTVAAGIAAGIQINSLIKRGRFANTDEMKNDFANNPNKNLAESTYMQNTGIELNTDEADEYAYGTGSTMTDSDRKIAELEAKAAEEARKAAEEQKKAAAALTNVGGTATSTNKAAEAAAKAAEAKAKLGDTILEKAEALQDMAPKVNGCADYVAAVLRAAGVDFGDAMDSSVEHAVATAKATPGMWHEGTEGMAKGDLPVYGDNDHIGIYDGASGVWHNSSSYGKATGTAPRPYHETEDMTLGMGIKGYIRTSGGGDGTTSSSKQLIQNMKQVQTALENSEKSAKALGKDFDAAYQSTMNGALSAGEQILAQVDTEHKERLANIDEWTDKYTEAVKTAQDNKIKAEQTGNAALITMAQAALDQRVAAEAVAQEKINAMKESSDQQYNEKKNSNALAQQALEADLRETQNEGDLAAYMELLTNKNAAFLEDLAQKQELMQTYYDWQMEANSSISSTAIEAANTLKSGLGDAFANAITGSKSLGESLSDLGKSIVAMFIKWKVQQMIASAFGTTLKTKETAEATAMGITIANATREAALYMNMLSGGTLAPTSAASLSGAVIAATAGGRIGFAHGGVVTAPTLGMIGEAGDNEAVIPLKKGIFADLFDDGKESTSQAVTPNFSINISAIDAEGVKAMLMKNGDQIVESLSNQARKFNFGGAKA